MSSVVVTGAGSGIGAATCRRLAAAGIEAGDIITKVQGKSVERYSDLPRLVGMVKPGDKVALQVFHDGKFKDVTADVIDFDGKTLRRDIAA